MDETWDRFYDLETKQQAMEWKASWFSKIKEISSAKISWNSPYFITSLHY
jgi:hypothetical protein